MSALTAIDNAIKQIEAEFSEIPGELIKARADFAELLEASRGMNGIGYHDGTYPDCAECHDIKRLEDAIANVDGTAPGPVATVYDAMGDRT